MAEVKKFSMRDQCYSIIREKILCQEYNLGEFINIVSLSNELSVSNTPIREALTQLEADGLVTSTMNSKAQVISFTEESFREISQMIHILVKGAYELCVEEDRIKQLLPLMENSLVQQEIYLSKGCYYQFTHESVNFDRCIFKALGNSQLLKVFKGLSNILFLMYRTNHQKNEQERIRSVAEHQQIVSAIASSKHTEVAYLLNAHYNKPYKESNID